MSVQTNASGLVENESGFCPPEWADVRSSRYESEQQTLALVSPFSASLDRRSAPRMRYRVEATLEVEADGSTEDLWLQTRDLDPSGTGFVTPHELSSGGRAVLQFVAPDGVTKRIECLVSRARPIAEGWYEGCVQFEGEQPLFSDQEIEAE